MIIIKTIKKTLLPLALLVLFVGCKKDHSILGVDVQPSVDELNADYLANLPVTAHTFLNDSVASFNQRYKFIGTNIDPYFGKTDIGLYLNNNINLTNLDFGVNSVLESAEIILAVDNFVFSGDTAAKLTFSIFPLDSSLIYGGVYSSTNTRLYNKNALINTHTGSYSQMSSGQTVLRIKVDSQFATNLMHDTPNLTNNTVFQAKYKGFYIATSISGNSEGIIFKADLQDAISGFYLHYKNGSASTDTIVDFKFLFSGISAVRLNTVKFDPIQTLKNQFQDSSLGATNLYLKGMGITKLKIQIPFLKDYSDSFQVAVNRAELILNVDPSFINQGRYSKPARLILLSIDSIGREKFLTDYFNATDYGRYDGNYDASNNRYVFNLAREAQLIFRGKKKNNGFYLVIGDLDAVLTKYYGSTKNLYWVTRNSSVDRVIFAGANNPSLKPKFNLSYVKFKND
jgi:hypothetical protein